MKLFFTGIITIVIGFIFWIIETGLFGWNMKPSCYTELYCDIASHSIMVLGIFIVYLNYQPQRQLLGVSTDGGYFNRFIKHQIKIFGFFITYKTNWIDKL